MNQSKTKLQQLNKIPHPDVDTGIKVQVNEIEETWYEWEAPERSFKNRGRDFWITAIAILVLVSVILIFIKEFFLIVALGSLLFLYYVLATIPPENIKIRISNKAVYFGEARYEWDLLENFWFAKSLDSETVNLGTWLRFPRVISLVINSKDKDKIKNLISKKIPFVKNSPSVVDKITRWAAERLPLEDKKEN